jgi:hypothetical protein
MALLRRPRKARKPPVVALRRPTKDCGYCQQLLRHRKRLDGHYVWVEPTQCEHRGRPYTINGSYWLTLCWCCAVKLIKRGVTVRERKPPNA